MPAIDRSLSLSLSLNLSDCRYVPEGWYHATLALEDSVSIAAQLGGVGEQQAATSVQRKSAH